VNKYLDFAFMARGQVSEPCRFSHPNQRNFT